ncbi:MAG: MarR family transcriptional regulator [Candidatus Thorarchaeota archaeon]|nr:MarR family transcriptional regulator [Candidatus Thorarchaeota archaeon]
MTREELVYNFIEALRDISRTTSYLANDDLGLEEFMILDIVSETDDCSMKDIIDGLSIAASTATGIVDRLVKRGFVKRKHSESDRRKVLLHLTSMGQDAHTRFRTEALNSVETALNHLTDEEIQTLLTIINKFLPHVAKR